MDELFSTESQLYMRVATVHRIYAVVIAQIAKGEWTVEEIGQRLGKPASWVTARLESPKGWTLNLVSDLCLAIGCEVHFGLSPFERRKRSADSAGDSNG